MSSSRAKGLMCTSSSSYVLQRVCTGLLSEYIILDFNFRSVLNIVFFILGDSTASEYYVPTFRNTLFHLHRWCKQEECLYMSVSPRGTIQLPVEGLFCVPTFNLLAPELFFLILAHTVNKMWIIHEPNRLQLWNKLYFEGKKRRVYTMFKIFSTYICWITI